jgi:hypothetical protein
VNDILKPRKTKKIVLLDKESDSSEGEESEDSEDSNKSGNAFLKKQNVMVSGSDDDGASRQNSESSDSSESEQIDDKKEEESLLDKINKLIEQVNKSKSVVVEEPKYFDNRDRRDTKLQNAIAKLKQYKEDIKKFQNKTTDSYIKIKDNIEALDIEIQRFSGSKLDMPKCEELVQNKIIEENATLENINVYEKPYDESGVSKFTDFMGKIDLHIAKMINTLKSKTPQNSIKYNLYLIGKLGSRC